MDKTKQEVIDRITALKAEGLTVREIQSALEKEGIKVGLMTISKYSAKSTCLYTQKEALGVRTNTRTELPISEVGNTNKVAQNCSVSTKKATVKDCYDFIVSKLDVHKLYELSVLLKQTLERHSCNSQTHIGR